MVEKFKPIICLMWGSVDTGQVFSYKPAQSSLLWGMSKGQESKFLAIFDKLYSSSGPQKPGYESDHKFRCKKQGANV